MNSDLLVFQHESRGGCVVGLGPAGGRPARSTSPGISECSGYKRMFRDSNCHVFKWSYLYDQRRAIGDDYAVFVLVHGVFGCAAEL